MNILEKQDFKRKIINATKEELIYLAKSLGKEKAISRLISEYSKLEKDKESNNDGGYTIALQFLKDIKKNEE
jgi:hypothetical protein